MFIERLTDSQVKNFATHAISETSKNKVEDLRLNLFVLSGDGEDFKVVYFTDDRIAGLSGFIYIYDFKCNLELGALSTHFDCTDDYQKFMYRTFDDEYVFKLKAHLDKEKKEKLKKINNKNKNTLNDLTK